MLKEPTQDQIDGPTLSEEVYHFALERIEALAGCAEDSPEERELIDWATIADHYERSAGIAESNRGGHSNDNVLAAAALAPAAQQAAQKADEEHRRVERWQERRHLNPT
jgi:hypothetical protein